MIDFLDPSKKRANKVRLYVGYGLVAVAVALTLYLLLIISYGFKYDRKSGGIVQNGLVFVSSHPVSADVYVNGTKKDTTSSRLALPSGQYTIELKRTGYRSWRKVLYLNGGSIEQLVYPWLFPQKIVRSDQQTYRTKPFFTSASPDRHWLVVASSIKVGSFDVFDITKKSKNETHLSLPAAALTSSSGRQSFSAVEWSSDNRHLLIKHGYGSRYEYLILDRQSPASSINLNKVLSSSPSEVVLRNKKFDQLYIYDAKSHNLSSASLRTNVTTKLITRVLAFKAYGSSTLYYVTDKSSVKGQFEFRFWNGTQTFLMQRYSAKNTYKIDAASYGGHGYIALASSSGDTIIYRDPTTLLNPNQIPTPIRTLKITSPMELSFSLNARFIAVQSGAKFAVYDIENDRYFHYTLSQHASGLGEAAWMDGHRLSVVSSGFAYVFDFDGTNLQKLSPATSGFPVIFNSDYSAMFNFDGSITKPKTEAIVRTELKV